MIVARQFIAWYPCENGNRPVGHGMIRCGRRATSRDEQSTPGKDQTVPYGTHSELDLFQAIPRPRDAWLRSLRAKSGPIAGYCCDRLQEGDQSDSKEGWPTYILAV